MRHLTEEDLVLLFYGEHPEAAAAAQHLEACPDCHEVDARLRAELQAVVLEAPPRGDDYGRLVWERLEPRLAADRAGRSRGRAIRRAAAILAMAASLVVAFLLGRHMPRPQGGSAPAVETRERILLVAVGEHLERSQMLLVELAHADAEAPVDVSGRAAQLVAANRLYRQSALRAGEAGVADVLDELERFLMEVANAPTPLDAGEVRELNERIEARGLLFKVRIVGSRLRERHREVDGPGGRPLRSQG
jgi:hypothetical protein